MLQRDQALLLVIDVQEKMMPVIHRREDVTREVVRLIRGARELGLPMRVTEQYVRGLGPTVPAVQEAMGEAYLPIEKMAFSACGEPRLMEALEATGRRQILLCGVETHVCVYQTARQLLEQGYEVHLVTDAVGSRAEGNYRLALETLGQRGAQLTSVEMALFELMVRADIPEFKAVSRLVK